jgi:hypothetical protein
LDNERTVERFTEPGRVDDNQLAWFGIFTGALWRYLNKGEKTDECSDNKNAQQTIANRYAYDLKVDIGTNGHLQATFYTPTVPLSAALICCFPCRPVRKLSNADAPNIARLSCCRRDGHHEMSYWCNLRGSSADRTISQKLVALRDFDPSDVGWGSKPIKLRMTNVFRFAFDNGHRTDATALPSRTGSQVYE